MPSDPSALKQHIHELKAIVDQYSIGGMLAAQRVTGVVETLLREVFLLGLPLLDENTQQEIANKITKMDNNKTGVERFTLGQLNNLFEATQFFKKYAQALESRIEVVKLIDLREFVKLRNKLTHEGMQLSISEAKFLISCLELFVDSFLPSATIPPSSSIFHVPHARNEYFTGREEILRRTHELLTKQQVVALHGLGGIGKTQTAVQYAHTHRPAYTDVLWLNAESVAAFNGSLATVAQTLGIEQQQQDEILKAVTHWLTTHTGWLLIADNADDLNLVKNFVSAVKAYGRVLLTTRASTTRPVAMSVEIVQMTEPEGTRFLYQRRGMKDADCEQEADYAQACELVRLMGGLPLALEQAAAYIDENQSTFAEYLTLYQQYEQRLLAERGQQPYDADHPLPVAVTWQASFDRIRDQNPQTLEVLEGCAFLSGDGIPEEILQTLFAVDDLQFKALLKPALAYSLLKRDADQRLLLIHRLVQVVLRGALSEEAQRQWVERLVTVVEDLFPDPEPIENWPVCQRLVSSALACAEEVKHSQLASETAALLLNQTAYYLKNRVADYATAQPLYERSLAIYEQILGKEHPHVATSLNNLALLYHAQGEYAQAQPLYERSLAIWEKVLGKEHPLVATSLNNLAYLYKVQGAYDQALPLYERSLAIREQVLGKEHPDVAQSLNNLAELYRTQGEYAQAQPLYERSLAIDEKVYGKDHPDVATDLNNLALLYQEQGAYAQALPLLERSLAIKEKVLGKEHPDTAISLWSLAVLRKSQHEYEQALPLYERALAIFQKTLGEQHPHTQTVAENYQALLEEINHP